MSSIEERIESIEKRNAQVESNKSWETSWVRKISIAILTYITVVVYHLIIDAENPLIVSIVPVIGFLLSTLSLQFIRKRFESNKGE